MTNFEQFVTETLKRIEAKIDSFDARNTMAHENIEERVTAHSSAWGNEIVDLRGKIHTQRLECVRNHGNGKSGL